MISTAGVQGIWEGIWAMPWWHYESFGSEGSETTKLKRCEFVWGVGRVPT